jgi:hypothetical protein
MQIEESFTALEDLGSIWAQEFAQAIQNVLLLTRARG